MSLKLHNLAAPRRAVCNLLQFIPITLALGGFLLVGTESFGQVNNEYRSFKSGPWSDLSTWERYNGVTWLPPTMGQGPPNSAKNVITVKSTHIVTVDLNTSADQFIIEAGAQVVVNSGFTLTIANGSSDMTVNGILDISGTVTKSTGAIIFINGEVINRAGSLTVMGSGLLIFNPNSFYRHLRNAGGIPNANWHSSSTCEVAGTLAGGISGLGQSFGNLIWNRTGQINNQSLPEAGSMSIAGNFTIHSTGMGRLQLNQAFLNVGGNFTKSGGIFRLANADNDRSMTVSGSASMTNDSLIMAAGGAGSMGVGTLEVKGNFSATGGTITETSLGDGYGKILLNGVATQSITATGVISDSINFSIDNPMGVLLASDLAIPGDLTFISGLFTLGAFDLQVNGDIIDADETAYVQTNGAGILKQTVSTTEVEFPVGNSAYNPATLARTAGSGVYNIRVIDGVFQNGMTGTPVTEKVVNRIWDVSADGDVGELTLTVQWNSGDEGLGFTRDQSYISHYVGGWQPDAEGAANGAGPYTLSRSGITGLSPFAIGSQGVLPIELMFFTATPKGKTVFLEWRTATELDNAYFHIERSTNGRDFAEIGKIAGAGTSLVPLDYTFTDVLPLNGWNYYRLRQVDFDGRFAYSPIQAVRMEKDGNKVGMQLFPNPASQELNLTTNDAMQPGDRLEIYDVTGQLVLRFSASDVFNVPVDVSQLPVGTYTVRLHTEKATFNASFVKQ